MRVTKRDGTTESADKRKLYRCVERSCHGLAVDVQEIVDEAYNQFFDGITTSQVDLATVLAARSRIVYEPDYSFAAARLLLHSLYREAFGKRVDGRSFDKDYRQAFRDNVALLVGERGLSPRLLEFDVDRLADGLRPDRDRLLKYLGVQTLYDRYLLKAGGRRAETPQAFWMRVAMGLSLNEPDPTSSAMESYELFSTLRVCPATPTLFNSGTVRPQLSSCFLSTLDDSIDGIFGNLHQLARLSKYAGGLGADVTPLRGTNAAIKGTNGRSQGLIPWLKFHNDLVNAVNQGGKRLGAEAVYCEVWHIDFPDFLELRKNTGDERRRCHDLHTASWICDEFMFAVRENRDWYLFSPDDVPDLHDAYGEDFRAKYRAYVEQADGGRITNFRVMKAKDLWRKMLTAVKETGHPWMTFKDAANVRYTNGHCGTVRSSNLCVEVLLHTKPTLYEEMRVVEVGETAVCTLSSLNVAAHADDRGDVDWASLARTVRKTVRNLDNAVDLNYYPTPETEKSHKAHRPLGLGLMGWHDLLHKRKLAFDSEGAVRLAGELQEFISLHAIGASAELARERGKYSSFDGSAWSVGKLPAATYLDLMGGRGDLGVTPSVCHGQDWAEVAGSVGRHGMRNSNVTAIAPTATISSIVGCSQGIDPDYSVLFVYSTLSGEFTMVNEHFVAEMKGLGLWSKAFAEELRRVDGDVKKMDLPADVQDRYKTAFDVDQRRLIDAGAERQKWVDQGQSLNLFYDGDSMKGLSDLYFHAWASGLKTTYYLRSRGANRTEKSTTDAACNLGEGCESCQ